jgi:MFS family permease
VPDTTPSPDSARTGGGRLGTGTTFRSLQVRNFRVYTTGQLISVTGTWMQIVGQAWLVLELTGSGAMLGVVTALQWLPTLCLGPLAGVIADRSDKRRIMLGTQGAAMAQALLLGIVVATGTVELWMVMVLALTLGLVAAMEGPARQTFIFEMVGGERVTNAVSLNTLTANLGRLVGPAIAGLLIAGWGVAACFFVNVASYLFTLGALLMVRRSELHAPPPVRRARGQLREGVRHVWSSPGLKVPLLLMVVMGTFTYEHQVLLPLMATDTYDVGAAGFGLLQSVMSVGAVVGGLFVARRTLPTHRLLTRSATIFGAATLLAAAMPTIRAAILPIALIGGTSVMFSTLVAATLQLHAEPEVRSRVMSLYQVAVIGTTPFGGPIVGWVAERWNPQVALALGGVAAVASGWFGWRALRGVPDPRVDDVEEVEVHDEVDAPDPSDALAELRPNTV